MIVTPHVLCATKIVTVPSATLQLAIDFSARSVTSMTSPSPRVSSVNVSWCTVIRAEPIGPAASGTDPPVAAARLRPMARPAQLQADRGNPRLKFLDRYLGIPVAAALSLPRRLRRARPVPARWDCVGIVLTAGIGDTVVASGVLHDIRVERPDVRIVLFVTANNAGFARLLPDPDVVVELPVRRIPAAVRMVRAESCDVILDLTSWRRYDAVLSMLAGAQVTIGRRTPGQFRHYGYD